MSYDTVVGAILENALKTPDKTAVAKGDIKLSYKEFSEKIKSEASRLLSLGIKRGDRVLITAYSSLEYVISFFALEYIGAAPVPVDKTFREETLLKNYNYIKPKAFLTDLELKGGEFNILPLCVLNKTFENNEGAPSYTEPNENSTAEILFTTGTTGEPKGVVLSYRAIKAITLNTKEGLGIEPSDIVLLPLPLSSSLGLRCLRTNLYAGGSVILCDGFSFPREIKTNMEKYSCTGVTLVPASVELLLRLMGDKFAVVFNKLRFIDIGAGSLSSGTKEKLLNALPDTKIYNTWGSTETGGVIFLDLKKYPQKKNSLGKPLNSAEIKILDEDGKEKDAFSQETAGRLTIKGDMIMDGYFNRPETNLKTIKDGALYTNDLVYKDSDGFIYMSGRTDDIINSGGKKISPVEIENTASSYRDMRECAVIGTDDKNGVLGQIPLLFAVPETGEIDANDLKRFLSSRLEKYKVPKEYIFLKELPRNRMKKIDRNELRKIAKNER